MWNHRLGHFAFAWMGQVTRCLCKISRLERSLTAWNCSSKNERPFPETPAE